MTVPYEYEERFVPAADGLKLCMRDYPPHGAVRGVPVICLHGLTRNSRDFEDVAPFMAAMGRRVLAMDVRGRGRSDRDPQLRYRADVYAGDVLHVLDSLQIPNAAFVGTSMGGIITMIVAAIAPVRVAAAVLNDVGPVIDATGIARIMAYVGKIGPYGSWAETAAAIRTAQSIAFPTAGEKFWQIFAHRVARELPDGSVMLDYDPAIREALLQPPTNPPPDMRAIFAALKPKNLLVLRGEISDVLAPSGVAAMRDIKPDLEFAEVPGVGHAPTLDEPASRHALAAFLSSGRAAAW